MKLTFGNLEKFANASPNALLLAIFDLIPACAGELGPLNHLMPFENWLRNCLSYQNDQRRVMTYGFQIKTFTPVGEGGSGR